MKKSLILFTIVMSIFILSACTKDVTKPQSGESKVKNNISEARETAQDNLMLMLAEEGKVDGLEFILGTSSSEIVEKWGMPDRFDYFAGGVYFAYEDKDTFFFTDGYIDGDKIVHGDIKVIWIQGNGREIFNVQIGMTFKEIIAVLGKPNLIMDPVVNEANEFYSEKWTINYHVGEYTVVFVASEEDGPVEYVLVFDAVN